MKSTRRMLKALAGLLPLGAAGVSAALAAAPAKPMVTADQEVAGQPNVADRLAAIRCAVSQLIVEQEGLPPGDPNIQNAWWSNWRPAWGNGGWRNGGWRNAPWGNWHNGWGNGGWHNWFNGWRNW